MTDDLSIKADAAARASQYVEEARFTLDAFDPDWLHPYPKEPWVLGRPFHLDLLDPVSLLARSLLLTAEIDRAGLEITGRHVRGEAADYYALGRLIATLQQFLRVYVPREEEEESAVNGQFANITPIDAHLIWPPYEGGE